MICIFSFAFLLNFFLFHVVVPPKLGHIFKLSDVGVRVDFQYLLVFAMMQHHPRMYIKHTNECTDVKEPFTHTCMLAV